ncbi:ABC transporter ATP-binding protein [Micromonospora sp. NPDC005206]|uniref:ABC transporter ATP-binding protein n=1 Tax=Micromonospora sp. NPDC005206 TaxID=3157022 RepID=UPI0033AC0523
MRVEATGITLKYGDSVAVDNLDLSVPDGEALVLLGQSGCGKTSTMRCIAGLETPQRGRIVIGDSVVYDESKGYSKPPHRRNIGMVFQSYAIWPHLSVFDNVAFPLRMKRAAKQVIRSKVDECLELVGLSHLAGRGASLLSGGQMQRVALARSLAMEPSILLLDEPLSNLDARLRDRLRVELRSIQQRLGLTSVYVTHDQAEAMALADQIALMQNGRIVQSGTPQQIYEHPRDATIASFFGIDNILPCTWSDASAVKLAGAEFSLLTDRSDNAAPSAADIRACIRAEDITLYKKEVAPATAMHGVVTVVTYHGAIERYELRIADEVSLSVVVPVQQGFSAKPGDLVAADVRPNAVRVLPGSGEST